MKAVLFDHPFSDPAWIFERKLDGVRCATFRLGGQVAQRAAPSQQRVKALLARRRGPRTPRPPAGLRHRAAGQRPLVRIGPDDHHVDRPL